PNNVFACEVNTKILSSSGTYEQGGRIGISDGTTSKHSSNYPTGNRFCQVAIQKVAREEKKEEKNGPEASTAGRYFFWSSFTDCDDCDTRCDQTSTSITDIKHSNLSIKSKGNLK
ncbi:MAG: hypothetical protein FWD94_05165, partial [Treponema sp.]|nr:hypothetical protein [Treponema sp.]